MSFRVDVPLITFITTGGTINGPAGPGTNAPIIFDLGFFSFHPGSSLGDPPGYIFMNTNYTLSASQISQLEAGLWYVNITSGTMPDGQLRGQILPVAPSIEDLCPCGGQWKNHGEYVHCVLTVAVAFVEEGLITEADKQAALKQAAASDCGKR